MNMKPFLRSLIIGLCLSVCAALPARAAVCPPFAENIVIAAISSTELALKAAQELLFKALSSQMEVFDKIQIAATKAVATQVATAAKAEIAAATALKQGEMAAIGQLETTKALSKIFQDYSAQTGQGVDPCGQLSAQTNVTLASGQVGAMAAESISHVAAAPGRYGNPEGFAARLLRQRQTMFATEDEAKLGFGVANRADVATAGGGRFNLAGADTNALVLFADTSDPRVKAAKTAYLEHVAGAPDIPLSADLAGLPSGKDYLALKARKDAVLSVALNSMATVSAENTPNGEIGKSKTQAMRDMVNQYYGRDAKLRWQGWAAQSQRGLMVDQLKIDAALLAVEVEKYQQAQRMEAVLGALLALEAQREFKPQLNASVQSIEAARTRAPIR